jgi:uncharacterized protein (DUF1778 family)
MYIWSDLPSEIGIIRLRKEDREVFFKAVSNPPEPNERAKAAVARYLRRRKK